MDTLEIAEQKLAAQTALQNKWLRIWKASEFISPPKGFWHNYCPICQDRIRLDSEFVTGYGWLHSCSKCSYVYVTN